MPRLKAAAMGLNKNQTPSEKNEPEKLSLSGL